jgi:hypothetical protein
MKKRPAKDDERENRIQMEIVVDAYNSEEQIMGWFCYLEDHLHVPFAARCIAHHATSPLQVGEEVEVVGMPSGNDCEPNMRVMIRWQGHEFAVPLQQLESIQADAQTQQAIEDWHYWVGQGYQFY